MVGLAITFFLSNGRGMEFGTRCNIGFGLTRRIVSMKIGTVNERIELFVSFSRFDFANSLLINDVDLKTPGDEISSQV